MFIFQYRLQNAFVLLLPEEDSLPWVIVPWLLNDPDVRPLAQVFKP